MQTKKIKVFLIVLFIFVNFSLFANDKVGEVTGKKIPRFISIKSSEANLRIGPNKDYPIKLKYIRKNIPLMVIDEFEFYGDQWRKVLDHDDNEGWIHRSLLSNNRYGIVKNKTFISVFLVPNRRLIGKIGYGNIVKIIKCEDNWCKIKIDNYTGWIKNTDFWGVFDNENFD
tara:strand:- start:1203 stop:1715 length:513 start_codon:yes stop_codon:yes gene_type:complete